jgi:hypothetical protein
VRGGEDLTLGSVAVPRPARDAADMEPPPTFLYIGAPDVPEDLSLPAYRRARRAKDAGRRRRARLLSPAIRLARRAA